ncbi:hypothetical protein Tco_1503590 [Tanacetum coccineum]
MSQRANPKAQVKELVLHQRFSMSQKANMQLMTAKSDKADDETFDEKEVHDDEKMHDADKIHANDEKTDEEIVDAEKVDTKKTE